MNKITPVEKSDIQYANRENSKFGDILTDGYNALYIVYANPYNNDELNLISLGDGKTCTLSRNDHKFKVPHGTKIELEVNI